MSNSFAILAATAVVATTLATGCATKRYVRNTVDPVNQKLSDVDRRTAENARTTQELGEKTERGLSRVDEKATAADARAGDAQKLAGAADSRAGQAGEKAGSAYTLAENGMARTGKLENLVENLDNFRVASKATILFGFNRSVLTDEAKKDLDTLAQFMSNLKRFVIEVQGFTDATGNPEYNYALSQKRAEAVVRYLATEYKIPVYRVHTVGLGKDLPAQPNKTSAGRKLNRRVEVMLYTPILVQQNAENASPSLPASEAKLDRRP